MVDKTDESSEWKDILLGQVKNQVVDFDVLSNILENSSDVEVKDLVLTVLENNYPFEFAIYKSRNNILEW